MNYFVSIVVTLGAVLLTKVCLSSDLFYRIPLLAGTSKYEDEYAVSKRAAKLITALVAVLSFAASLRLFAITDEPVNIIKIEMVILLLPGAAAVDLREHRIPNAFSATILLSGVVLLIAGVVTGQNGAVAYVSSSLIATAVTTLGFLIVRLLSKSGIGLGDIKLLAALAMAGGVYAVGGTLIFGIILCAFAAVILLLTKKKTIQGSVPFGPFIYLGFLLTIFMSIL